MLLGQTDRLERLIAILGNSRQLIDADVLQGQPWLSAAHRHCKVVCVTLTFVGIAKCYPSEDYRQILDRSQRLMQLIRCGDAPPSEAFKYDVLRRFEHLLVA